MIIHDITRLIVLLGLYKLFLVRIHRKAQDAAQENTFLCLVMLWKCDEWQGVSVRRRFRGKIGADNGLVAGCLWRSGICLAGILYLCMAVAPVQARPLQNDVPQHLIQTVTDQEVYEGALALGLMLTPVLEEEDCGKAYENVKSCVVRIQMGNAHGSGIIWELTPEQVVVATNRHVLEYWEEADSYIHFPQGYDTDADVLGVSEQYDVGFLAVDNRQFTYEELGGLRCARRDRQVYEQLQPGDEMFLVHSASGTEEAQFYEATVEDIWRYIADFDAYMLYGHGFARTGMSGGGTFDGCGYLIAMTTGGTLENETAGVPLPQLTDAYDEVVLQGHSQF